MTQNTGNIISFIAAKQDNERIHKPRLADIPHDELVDVVRGELEEVVSNLLPHNATQEDVEVLTKAFNTVLLEGPDQS